MKNIFTVLIFIASWIFIAVTQFHNVLSGSIPFWYDPARDMLMGWDNLHKLTLIGPTSGIPGIFYGPHWIWMLSFGELFSKDPRIVILIVETIPYLILFPLALFLFVRSKIFDALTAVFLWIVFAYSFGGYIDSIWSPNSAPIVLLFVIYFLVTSSYMQFSKKLLVQTFVAGLLAGFAFQLQISFSTGFILGCILFLVVATLISANKSAQKNTIKVLISSVISFVLGLGIVFSPIFLFEVRHNFLQSKTALNALSKGGGVVGLHGLTKQEIFWNYVGRMSTFFHTPIYPTVGVIVMLLIFILIGYRLRVVTINYSEKLLLVLLACITCGVLGIYLSAKNPVWAYHFIGSEIIAMMVLGFILFKIKSMRVVMFLFIGYMTYIQVQGLIASYKIDPLLESSLYTKEHEVKIIQQDAKTNQYAVYAYSPSIYTYEYSYLFKWLTNKDFSYDPSQIRKENLTYLIVPAGDKAKLDDFIHYRTPDTEYITTKIWRIPDRTIILKREHL